ncbi:MAG TPA: NUDIX hydrolase [Candidatus Binatia bacterium]|jgi:ADP-ribose pyrophosphatase YjhB (NUDIX family)
MAEKYSNPLLTVDIIVELADGTIVLIARKNPPPGWALPGGFVDYGEAIEHAAMREAKEEISLDVNLTEQLYTYSDPTRDPRHHTVSTVFIATAEGVPEAADDAKAVRTFLENNLPAPLAFDHARILRDYFRFKKTGARPKPEIGRKLS